MSGHIRSPILPATPPDHAPVQPRAGPMAILIAVLGAAAILLSEAVTPLALSMGCFYMMLATYAAMRLGEITMTGLLAATCLGGMTIHHFQLAGAGPVGPGLSGAEIWNGATRLITICLFGVVLRRLLRSLRGEKLRAQRDPLTGALNRRALFDRFAALAARPEWENGVCAVVFLDLDAFKAANDRFGHAAGDALLARLVFAATGALNDRDLFARIGGDEFIALLVGSDEQSVEQRVYALHAHLGVVLAETQLGVTCSSGAVVARVRRGQTLDALIMRADRLMYEVKDGGKDGVRIVCRGPSEPRIELDPGYPRRRRAREVRRNTA